MSKYADFKGRARRSEYWWFSLFVTLLSWGALVVEGVAVDDVDEAAAGIVSGIVNLALLLPSIAAGARRLHDTNRSGWWQLLAVTIIGLIPLIIWTASQGDRQPNRFGDPV